MLHDELQHTTYYINLLEFFLSYSSFNFACSTDYIVNI